MDEVIIDERILLNAEAYRMVDKKSIFSLIQHITARFRRKKEHQKIVKIETVDFSFL